MTASQQTCPSDGKSIRDSLSQITSCAFNDTIGRAEFGTVLRSNRPELADFQCNDAMAAAKKAGIAPHQVARKVADIINNRAGNQVVATVAGPGFINFRIKTDFLSEQANRILSCKNSGFRPFGNQEKVILDYGGPNVAKAMHVGHLRSAVIDQCLKNVYRYNGYDAISDIHLGDWGLQMGQLIVEIKERFPELAYFDPDQTGNLPSSPPFSMDDLLQWYPVASAKSKKDPAIRHDARMATAQLQNKNVGYRALWQHMVDISVREIKKDYTRLGIDFDQWFGESRYQEHLNALVRRLYDQGVIKESEGALIIETSDNLPPCMIRKSDGGYGYGATDLATIDQRTDQFAARTILYVVDSRQSTHFSQVFSAARKAGIDRGAQLKHLGFGTVNGTDGKPFKTREGGVMRLSDLMQILVDEARKHAIDADEDRRNQIAEKVGIAAIKYADLQHDRESDYIFDMHKFMRFEGKTGPYLQYTCARINSLIKRAESVKIHAAKAIDIQDQHKPMILELDNFENVIRKTLEKGKPHLLAEHTYHVAMLYNNFYGNNKIIDEKDNALSSQHIFLSKNIGRHLGLCLDLLGIDVPQKM